MKKLLNFVNDPQKIEYCVYRPPPRKPSHQYQVDSLSTVVGISTVLRFFKRFLPAAQWLGHVVVGKIGCSSCWEDTFLVLLDLDIIQVVMLVGGTIFCF